MESTLVLAGFFILLFFIGIYLLLSKQNKAKEQTKPEEVHVLLVPNNALHLTPKQAEQWLQKQINELEQFPAHQNNIERLWATASHLENVLRDLGKRHAIIASIHSRCPLEIPIADVNPDEFSHKDPIDSEPDPMVLIIHLLKILQKVVMNTSRLTIDLESIVDLQETLKLQQMELVSPTPESNPDDLIEMVPPSALEYYGIQETLYEIEGSRPLPDMARSIRCRGVSRNTEQSMPIASGDSTHTLTRAMSSGTAPQSARLDRFSMTTDETFEKEQDSRGGPSPQWQSLAFNPSTNLHHRKNEEKNMKRSLAHDYDFLDD